jgi:hypothetical protein
LKPISHLGKVGIDGLSDISRFSSNHLLLHSPKETGQKTAREAIKHTLDIYYPATVTDEDINKALDLTWDDFKDSVQFVIGEGLSVDYIVTRNTQDFSFNTILAVTPEQFIQIIANM